jgi:hypothetical protein
MPNEKPQRLPIKLILPRQGKERPISTGGSEPVPFRTVDKEYRQRLAHQVNVLRKALTPQVRRVGNIPVRVKLLSNAHLGDCGQRFGAWWTAQDCFVT